MSKSRNKGASFERNVCTWLRDQFGGNPRRNLVQYQVAGEGDIIYPPFIIECKRYASGHWHRPEWWKQVLSASEGTSLLPLLIYKFDRVPMRFVFRLADVGDYPERNNETVTVSPVEAELIMRERIVSVRSEEIEERFTAFSASKSSTGDATSRGPALLTACVNATDKEDAGCS